MPLLNDTTAGTASKRKAINNRNIDKALLKRVVLCVTPMFFQTTFLPLTRDLTEKIDFSKSEAIVWSSFGYTDDF